MVHLILFCENGYQLSFLLNLLKVLKKISWVEMVNKKLVTSFIFSENWKKQMTLLSNNDETIWKESLALQMSQKHQNYNCISNKGLHTL